MLMHMGLCVMRLCSVRCRRSLFRPLSKFCVEVDRRCDSYPMCNCVVTDERATLSNGGRDEKREEIKRNL